MFCLRKAGTLNINAAAFTGSRGRDRQGSKTDCVLEARSDEIESSFHRHGRDKPGHDSGEMDKYDRNACYFFGSAALSRRSILASARSLVTRSTCALRDANCSISPRTLSNGGGSRVRLSSTLSTCQPNGVLTGEEISPFSRLKATSENSGTIWSRVK